MEYVSYEDFKKLDMRVGWIRFVEPVEGADKLLRFEIDFGTLALKCSGDCEQIECQHQNNEDCNCESDCTCDYGGPAFGKPEYTGRDVRQIVSGIHEVFPKYENLVGKKALYVVNLEPRKIRGVESHGMLMAVDGLNDEPIFLVPEGTVEPGSQVR